jgi:hypothetical protein
MVTKKPGPTVQVRLRAVPGEHLPEESQFKPVPWLGERCNLDPNAPHTANKLYPERIGVELYNRMTHVLRIVVMIGDAKL